MNAIRAIVQSSFRGYRTNRGSRRSNPWDSPAKREIEMVQPDMPVERFDDTANDEFEDLDAYESDFSNVGEYHKMHEKELSIQKKKLLNQIVKRKYFKTDEPNMLTWGEKEQIRLLHSQDPEEWPPERLSDSFPASTEAVLKVLRAKWEPKTTKVIENYEKTVKNNWELFKAGKLKIDPKLHAHLANFKNRHINIMNEEEMKKFLKPKPVFPKPKSAVFSSIIQGYLDSNEASEELEEQKRRIKEEKRSVRESMKKEPEQIASGVKDTVRMMNREKSGESLTFDAFLKKHVECVTENKVTPVDRVIIDEYKQRNAEADRSKFLVLKSESAVGNHSPVDTFEPSTSSNNDVQTSSIAKIPLKISEKTEIRAIDENSMETGIIARVRREGVTDDEYPEFIKIPRKKYKRGVTYRIEDRYYDCDGEFLYRVIGLRS